MAALRYDSELVAHVDMGVGLVSRAVAVDWFGEGKRDLLLHTPSNYYPTGVYLYRALDEQVDGLPVYDTPTLTSFTGDPVVLPIFGEAEWDLLELLKGELRIHRNTGPTGQPRFAEPVIVPFDPPKGWGHFLRPCVLDWDRDGTWDLLLGATHWAGYWPSPEGWSEDLSFADDLAFRYEENGDWRGGPLHGHIHLYRNTGSATAPKLEHEGRLETTDGVLDVYGNPACCWADLSGGNDPDLILCDFMNRVFRCNTEATEGGYEFSPPCAVEADRKPIELFGCIPSIEAADLTGNGCPDLIFGMEDGHVYCSLNRSPNAGGLATPVRLQQRPAAIKTNVLVVPAAGDLDGDGDSDLILGLASGEVLMLENEGTPSSPRWGRPRHIDVDDGFTRRVAGPSGSIQGPSEALWGYFAPELGDWTGNGLPDILVGNILGTYMLFRNIGTRTTPRFAAPQELMLNGETFVSCWRVKPILVYIDGDGNVEMIALDPHGCLRIYRRADRDDPQAIKKGDLLRKTDGSPIKADATGRLDGFTGRGRNKLCACDWDGNGLCDILSGRGGSSLQLYRNVGTRADPAFEDAVPILYRDGTQPPFGCHSCAPCVIDLDGDGVPELVVGTEGGTLEYFRRDELMAGPTSGPR